MNTLTVGKQVFISASEDQFKGYGLPPEQCGEGVMSIERALGHSPKKILKTYLFIVTSEKTQNLYTLSSLGLSWLNLFLTTYHNV